MNKKVNVKEVLNRYFSEKQLNYILAACGCQLSDVRVSFGVCAYHAEFPYEEYLAIPDLIEISKFGHWFDVQHDCLYFVFVK